MAVEFYASTPSNDVTDAPSELKRSVLASVVNMNLLGGPFNLLV